MDPLHSTYGPAAVAVAIASEFEVPNFEKIVKGKTHVRLLS
jgi:hypothetical protein